MAEDRVAYPGPNEQRVVRGFNNQNYQNYDEIEHSSLSWRAIFAGTAISLLSYFILTSLGIAVGGATLQGVIQSGGQGGQSLGLGSGIWLVISAFISLFVGSYLAARASGYIPSRLGGIQGLVITALFFGFLLSQIGSAIGALGSGMGSAVSGMSSAASDVSQNPQVQGVVENALGGLKLKSPPDQVARGLATRVLRGDTNGAKNYLANQAGISPAEADRRIRSFTNDLQNRAKEIGSQAAKATSIAGWSAFGSLVLGSLFAILGGGAGARATLSRPVSRGDTRRIEKTKAA